MKVIFLDNDGVICLGSNWGSRSKKRAEWAKKNGPTPDEKMPVYYRFDHFDKKAIKILNEILEATGAEIVVSSDWRLYANLEELGDYYEQYDIIKKPIAVTAQLSNIDSDADSLYKWRGQNGHIRAHEIRHWLKNHPEVTAWVAVDDIDMGKRETRSKDEEWGLEHFVLTPRSTEGIKQSGLKDKIITILNEKV